MSQYVRCHNTFRNICSTLDTIDIIYAVLRGERLYCPWHAIYGYEMFYMIYTLLYLTYIFVVYCTQHTTSTTQRNNGVCNLYMTVLYYMQYIVRGVHYILKNMQVFLRINM